MLDDEQRIWMLNEQEFIDFTVTQISNSLPNVLVQQHENDPMRLLIWHTGQSEEERREINLHNAWRNYQRSGEMDVITNFVEALSEFAAKEREEVQDQDINVLIPLIRPEGFSGRDYEGHKITLMYDEITDGIEIDYAFDSEKLVQFAIEEQLPKGYNQDKAKLQAKENLKCRGWQDANVSESAPFGKVSVYNNQKQPYNAQFLIPELYETKIGNSFYVAFPTYDVCVVLKMHTYIKNSKTFKKNALAAFSAYVYDMYRKLPAPLAPFAYEMDAGKLTRVTL